MSSILSYFTTKKVESVSYGPSLEDLARKANTAHANGRAALQRGLENYRAAGLALLDAKAQLGHGQWLPWLKANCPEISDRQARRYMELAKVDVTSDLDLEEKWREINGNVPTLLSEAVPELPVALPAPTPVEALPAVEEAAVALPALPDTECPPDGHAMSVAPTSDVGAAPFSLYTDPAEESRPSRRGKTNPAEESRPSRRGKTNPAEESRPSRRGKTNEAWTVEDAVVELFCARVLDQAEIVAILERVLVQARERPELKVVA